MTVSPLRTIYQLKINLVNAKPPIWRRLLVQSDINLSSFHNVIQIVMGWTDSHLHQFIANQVFYSPPNEYDELDSKDESKFKLSQLLKKEKDKIIYEYDFGDSWKHEIKLEKILPFDANKLLPYCIKGKRACPPEDCGGVWGYDDIIETTGNPNHPEYEERLEWLGEEFDPEYFDAGEVNALFMKVFN